MVTAVRLPVPELRLCLFDGLCGTARTSDVTSNPLGTESGRQMMESGSLTEDRTFSASSVGVVGAGASCPSSGLVQTVVLVGLMGAGKTAIGKRLAARLGLEFVDADAEIEAAAGCSIEEYFARHGEAAFREGERRVIARLIESPVHILATGGGAFIDPGTRALLRGRCTTVWLSAALDVLVARTARRTNRPLLKQGEPREILARLIAARYPIYAEADLTIDSEDAPLDEMVERVLVAVERHVGRVLPRHPPLPESPALESAVDVGLKQVKAKP